jgi:thiamine monophosphate synthase
VTLPPLVVVTNRHQAGRRGLAAVVAAAVEGGARWILLRDRDLPAPERRALRARLEPIVAGAGGILGDAGDAGDAPVRHLAAAEPFPVPRPALVGRSCHTPVELDGAAAEGCDYAFLSPVYETSSKPGYGPPIGPARLAAWCAATTLPVYALGGIDAGRAGDCRRAGAAGVAVMGAVMGAGDPAAVTAGLLRAWHRATSPPRPGAAPSPEPATGGRA